MTMGAPVGMYPMAPKKRELMIGSMARRRAQCGRCLPALAWPASTRFDDAGVHRYLSPPTKGVHYRQTIDNMGIDLVRLLETNPVASAKTVVVWQGVHAKMPAMVNLFTFACLSGIHPPCAARRTSRRRLTAAGRTRRPRSRHHPVQPLRAAGNHLNRTGHSCRVIPVRHACPWLYAAGRPPAPARTCAAPAWPAVARHRVATGRLCALPSARASGHTPRPASRDRHRARLCRNHRMILPLGLRGPPHPAAARTAGPARRLGPTLQGRRRP